ncbi:MAG: alpha/beta fold hydrolase [Dehalococcoidia bacterium]
MPYLERPDARVYYEVQGSGPALIFAHGLGGNHLSWWQQVPAFRDRYTCVTFAHRGFWPSEESSGGPGPAAFVDDLAALIEHLGFEDVRLVAQSMGGWTCLGYPLREPSRVQALVLADTTGSLALPESELQAFAEADAASAALFARGIHPAAGERMAREQPTLHFLYTEINALSVGLDKETLRATLMRLRETPPEAGKDLAVPVLCIAGDEDVVIPPRIVEWAATLFPDARFERVPRAGHSVYFERPDVFNRLVGDFLTATESGRGPARGGVAADG